MAALDGAFYGPAIPPPTKATHRGRSCGCCLLSTILKIIVAVVVIIGLTVLILWLVFRPNKLQFHVTDATLAQFNISNDNQLHYNLALNITIRNPNRRIGIYYDVIEADAIYKDQRLKTQLLTPFYQGHKTTSVISPTFEGQQMVLLGGEERVEYNAESISRVYDIEVNIRLRLRLKFGAVRIGNFRPNVGCEFMVPLSSNGRSGFPFQATGCEFDF